MWWKTFAAICLTNFCWGTEPVSKPAAPPNVITFLIDDLGCTDIGIDGSTFHETPRLDSLARSGVRWTQFYSACPVCSPTRASFMTGKVPQRLGITDFIRPETPVALPHSETTLAESFASHGYQTSYFGKWHLGEDDANMPQRHGFQWTCGVNRAGQPASYYSPFRKNPGRPSVWDVPDLDRGEPTDYLTDRLTDEVIARLKAHNRAKPFLMCINHYAVHTPIQPPKQLVEKYRLKSELLFQGKQQPAIEGTFGALSRPRQDDLEYAAMVENLDANVGRVLDALDELGLRQNTIVVFTSDNGGLCTLPKRVGPTSNLPQRSGKGWTYEGGIRVPCYVSWPGQLAPAISKSPAFTADLYPTLLELCNLPAAPAQHLDGRSLAQILRGTKSVEENERFLAWYYPHQHGSGHQPSAAIRKGPWKLIRYLTDEQTELYRLDLDPGEQTNIAKQHPEIVNQLVAELLQWIEATRQKS